MAEQAVYNPQDSFASWDGTEIIVMEERIYEANATIAVGEALSLDIGTTVDCKKVVLADSNLAGARAFCGIALEAGVAGDLIKVMKKGIHTACVTATGPSKGDNLFVDAGTAGQLDDDADALPDTIWAGVALADEAGGATTAAFICAPF